MSKRRQRRTRGTFRAVRRVIDRIISADKFAFSVAVEDMHAGDLLILESPRRFRSVDEAIRLRDQLLALLSGGARAIVLEEGMRLKILRLQPEVADHPRDEYTESAK